MFDAIRMGDYYVGMTKKEAITKGLYKKTIGMDFYDIDTNHNGVLSSDEIDNACSKERTRELIAGAVESVVGVALMAGGGLLELPSLGTTTSLLAAGGAMVVDGAGRMSDAATDLRCFAKKQTKKQIKSIFTGK